MRTGVFTGSFDPFTIGHHSIVLRMLPLFDKIVIGVGTNIAKTYAFSDQERLDNIQKVYANQPKVAVKLFNDLTVDFAKREQATCIVKGVRSAKDFEFEREQADINHQLTGIETILLVAEPSFASVSSSMVRELMRFGVDISRWLP